MPFSSGRLRDVQAEGKQSKNQWILYRDSPENGARHDPPYRFSGVEGRSLGRDASGEGLFVIQ